MLITKREINLLEEIYNDMTNYMSILTKYEKERGGQVDFSDENRLPLIVEKRVNRLERLIKKGEF